MQKKYGLLMLLILSGCAAEPEDGLPVKVVYTEEEEDKPVSADETVMAELYAVDENGFLVPQTVAIEGNSQEEQAALIALAEGSVPAGFRSPLPEGTVIQDVELDGKTATVSVGGAFDQYPAEEEELVASAITWTVTGIGQADRVQIKFNGETLREMPKAGMPIAAGGMKREDGINLKAGYTDTGATKPITVFFTGQNEKGTYLVPVTRRISEEETDLITASVEELAKGPVPGSGLMTSWPADAKLVEEPAVENGRAVLQFNDAILEDNGEALVSSSLLKPLSFTLAASAEIESVAVQVEGHPDVKMETGAPLPASLTTPLFINEESLPSAE
ncbi:GerMN domain-containing protein [Domibacillus robiginosus]|uniref:GerMN domain-containing protein n=1 Tax=Domibacillus robiginosus TaxID=1071054 RepID=UPI00067BE7A7|nr:GerMN domain-containing protein [Domibacillus robiginosus]